jgi:hypothetical protein
LAIALPIRPKPATPTFIAFSLLSYCPWFS